MNEIMSWVSNPIGSLIGLANGGYGSGGTIWNHGDKYRVESLGESANQFSGSGMDPNGFIAGIWNDFTGVTAQSREFAQQEYLMDKQNAYNHPVQQMARMKAAGINPNTAAAGISQGGNESAQAPQVSSNTSGASQGLSAVGAAAGAVTGGISTLGQLASLIRKNNAEASNQEAQAFRSDKLLPLDYRLSLENIGLTRGQSIAMAIENFYRPEQQMLQTAQMYLQLPMMIKQMDLLDAQYSSEMKSIDLMDQQILESKGRVDLMTWDKMVAESVARKNNAEANLISRKFQLLRDFGWDPTTGVGGLLAGNFIMRNSENSEKGNEVFDDLLATMWLEAFEKSEGDAYGSVDIKKGLIKAQEEATGRLQGQQGKIDIGKQGLQSALNVGETYLNKPKFRAFGLGIE